MVRIFFCLFLQFILHVLVYVKFSKYVKIKKKNVKIPQNLTKNKKSKKKNNNLGEYIIIYFISVWLSILIFSLSKLMLAYEIGLTFV